MRGLTPAQRAFDAQVVDGRPKAGHDAAGRYAASRYCPRLSCRTPPTVMPGLGPGIHAFAGAGRILAINRPKL